MIHVGVIESYRINSLPFTRSYRGLVTKRHSSNFSDDFGFNPANFIASQTNVISIQICSIAQSLSFLSLHFPYYFLIILHLSQSLSEGAVLCAGIRLTTFDWLEGYKCSLGYFPLSTARAADISFRLMTLLQLLKLQHSSTSNPIIIIYQHNHSSFPLVFPSPNTPSDIYPLTRTETFDKTTTFAFVCHRLLPSSALIAIASHSDRILTHFGWPAIY